jgi:pimeloyl-ACP methyl ester carboxylesterase
METNIYKWALQTLCYDDVQDLLSCFFFGKDVDRLLDWEIVEMKRLFDYLENHFDLKVKPGRSNCCTPRLLTLEDVDPWHRPLAVYAGVQAFQWGKAGLLRLMGFRHYVSTTGLQYWYRPADTSSAKTPAPPPLLFFHGIAPGGSAIYVPMLLWGVANDGRALFIFENKPVSCHPSFDVLTEDETIQGVQEALERFDIQGDISLMGHSFGSFQLTWLIYSPLRDRIRQFVLLDPVSILLSEPDLIINFENATPLFKIVLKELWTNYYIRRHFSWYRSELWLDDLPSNVEIFVGLAENDQIVNGPKVKLEIEIFGSEQLEFAKQTTIAFWPKALHGDCLYQPSKWRDIRAFFDKANISGSETSTATGTSSDPKKEKVC